MLGVRLDSETERSLEELARRTHRPKSQIAREAIQDYVSRNDLVARAQREWELIGLAERDDPEMAEILDFGERTRSDLP